MPTETRTAARPASARQFFSRGGTLSKWHPNYEFRAGQAEMAEAVESAIADKRHLIVEAGTGTGKTLAYLVPALQSGKRIVVSTGTKNLQEQLFFKDVPFLQKHFDRPLEVCYMKGRANYACRQKIYARRDLCSGQKCPQFERCFITLMHQRAAQSDIIIVNHHLFFADLAIKDEDVPGILPDYHAVVFDEAHEIEDVAGQYFGVQISNYRFQE